MHVGGKLSTYFVTFRYKYIHRDRHRWFLSLLGMDYSAAVKGNQHSTKDFILSQAELELGHQLTEEETRILLSISSQESMIQRIQKYGFGTIKFLMFLSKRPQFNIFNILVSRAQPKPLKPGTYREPGSVKFSKTRN